MKRLLILSLSVAGMMMAAASHFALGQPGPPEVLKLQLSKEYLELKQKNQSLKILEELQGRWVLKRHVHQSKDSTSPSSVMEIVNNQVYFVRDGKRTLREVLVVYLDRPGQIDSVNVIQEDDPGQEANFSLGIYQVHEGRATFCIARPGNDRPVELAPGPKCTFSVWERAK